MIGGSSHPPVAEPSFERGGARHPAPCGGAMLEAEIADLIKDKFILSGQSDDWDRQQDAWDETSASRQQTDAKHEADDTAADSNGACHERPAWNADVKVYDPEKLAGLASSSAYPAIVGLLSLAALGIAGFGAWNSSYFVEAVPSSIPVGQKPASFTSHGPVSTLPPSAAEPPRQEMPSVSTNGKIDDPIAKELGNRREPAQKAVPATGDTKRTALVPQNTASAPASAAVHRQPKPLPMPFPETKPATIDGWVVREVAKGTAVLQGPNGVWKAARGDTVPGLGKVDSIVLWGNRWIVATSRGLVTTQ
jgi:hypothetical protein